MAVKLLDAATTTGASPRWNASGSIYHTVQVNITGSPTAVTVDLEGSLDDNTYFTLASHSMTSSELTASAAMFHVETKRVHYIKTNVTTLTGGSSPTVTIRYFGDES